MRVLMVTPGYYPIVGGTESMVKILSTELNRTGVTTDILTFNMDKKWSPKWSNKIEIIDNLKIYRIAGLKWFPVPSSRFNMDINLIPGRFTQILKQYDIIHYHELEYSFPLFSLMINKPKILHLHGIFFNILKKYPINRMILLHAADYYFAINKKMIPELIELGIPKDRIYYFPNFIDTKFFIPSKEKIFNTILFVGRIIPEKGLNILLKSLEKIHNKVHLFIIGPQDFSSVFFQNIINLIEIENQRGKHKITYLGTFEQRDLISWYQKSSILVLPSVGEEAFGIVILEALACGTPVIATNVGGVPEAFEDGKNGILVPANNAKKLGEAIDYLLDNENIRIKFGENGRNWVEKNFSLETSIKKLCGIYKLMYNIDNVN